MKKRKVTLGLDIGIASVGFGLIDADTGEILESGVRLFSSAEPSKNQDRRSNRQSRRLNRRKKHRLERITELLEEYNFFKGEISEETPYHIRVKALKEKVSREDLFAALYNLAKRRGISYLEDADLEGLDESSTLGRNVELLNTYHPGEIQLKRYEEYGKVRGTVKITEDNMFVNIFPTSAYVKEAIAIIEKQQEFYSEIDDEFKNKYINIIESKRSYSDGPGNEKSRTDYGIYRTNGETWKNIFDILIGKCSMYPEEKRASAFSYTAQLYNFLNDLNNLIIGGEKLTIVQKEEILKEVMNSKMVSMSKIISKVANCKVDDIKGFRIDKQGKPEFHTFEYFRKLRKFLESKEIEINDFFDNINTFDDIASVLTLNTEYIKIIEGIKEVSPDINDDLIKKLAEFRKKNSSIFSKWHSLSLKGMREIQEELWVTSNNQMQIVKEMGLFKSKCEDFKGLKYIPADKIVDEIYNPVVAGSVRESVKIINALLKKYSQIDSLVIEMPREDNNIDQKKKIEKMQKENEEIKNSSVQKAKSEYSFTDDVYKNHKSLGLKIQLWYEQNGKCVYSGKNISIHDLVKNPNMFEIDHIIPKSISFDDSTNNKVICYYNENQFKGNKTPFYYFKQKSLSDWNYDEYKKYITDNLFMKKQISQTKKDLLLFEENINKYEVRQRFISRNLNDTRYASRTLLNTLQDFMKVNYPESTISVVRGKLTSKLRRVWKLEKNRDEDFSHHAVDALIVASVKHLKIWNKIGNKLEKNNEEVCDELTGELLSENKSSLLTNDEYDKEVYTPPFNAFIDQLKYVVPKSCRYSHKVDRKYNRQVADATIYSTRQGVSKDSCYTKDSKSNVHYVVSKIKNIYDDTDAGRFLARYNKDKTQFLMYHNDPKTFEIIEKVIRSYPTEKNPFVAFKNEHGIIRKYSKKSNGPEIHSIKYYDTKLGSHIEINESDSANKKTVLLSIKPWRADVYYDVENDKHIIVGLKYSDLKYLPNNKGYGIRIEEYLNKNLKSEGIDMTEEQLTKNNGQSDKFKYRFSLYKNDIVSWDVEESTECYRFLSKMSTDPRCEFKPINKQNFEKRKYINILKVKKLTKINTDILGNQYSVTQEKLILSFKMLSFKKD